MRQRPIEVIKLGGSLLELPDLVFRLRSWLTNHAHVRRVLVVGGGALAEVVRGLDARHRLGDEVAHWLAIRAMLINAHLVAAMLPRTKPANGREVCVEAWQNRKIPIVEPLDWLTRSEAKGTTIPHRWTFTSDSIAARIAGELHAAKLILLKSRDVPHGCTLQEAARRGVVDEEFPVEAGQIPRVELVNFRAQPVRRYVLQPDPPRRGRA